MKLYVLVRDDLPSKSYKAVQAGHAVAKFMIDHRGTWKNDYLIYLRVSSEDKLKQIEKELREDDYKAISVFQEPDLENAATAMAVSGPGLTYRLQNFSLL